MVDGENRNKGIVEVKRALLSLEKDEPEFIVLVVVKSWYSERDNEIKGTHLARIKSGIAGYCPPGGETLVMDALKEVISKLLQEPLD